MDDLTAEFLVETNESMEALELDFVNLEKNPDDKEIIGNIFRMMHTVKGTCGFLGLSRLESVAHAGENILDKLRDGAFGVTPPIISLILEANDRIKEIVEELEETGEEPAGDDSELIGKLNFCADNNGQIGDAPTPKKTVELSDDTQDESVSAQGAISGENKTPDLDEAIDFDPIPAPGADASAGSGNETTSESDINKTPDLDEAIDFDPIPAPGADKDAVMIAVNDVEERGLETMTLSERVKERAVAKGLQTMSGDGGGGEAKKANVGQSIRVSIDVLEELMQMVGELVLTRNQLLQMTRNKESSDLGGIDAPLQRLNHVTTELQAGVMQTRMQPIGNAWAKFPRLIRDLSIDLEKEIELEMIGADTELDRQMLESIKDPLTHMVRNSADHGVELPAERELAGKSRNGTITLDAYHEGGHIVIKIEDDGKGLDVERIKNKAIENNLATLEELNGMSEKQIYQFIFHAGFSTAEKVTSVSGRGVGMDVVVSNIESAGGTVEVDSTPGKGSRFLIKLPLTLAIMPVLIVEVAGEVFAIPQIRVLEIVSTNAKSADTDDHIIEKLNGSPVLRLRGHLLPLISTAETLNMTRETPVSTPEDLEEIQDSAAIAVNDVSENGEDNAEELISAEETFVVVCEVGSQHFGLLVDRVFHTEEIVVKPTGALIKDVEAYAGCTILGDGSVIMILDANGVVKTSGVKAVEKMDSQEAASTSGDDKEVSFLKFSAWSDMCYAIPLELVSRLEEINTNDIEWSGNQPVIQYRGGLMSLVMVLPDTKIPEDQMVEVVVFADGEKVMGIVVEQIIDIVSSVLEIKSSSQIKGMLGSTIIDGVTTQLVNVSHFFAETFEDWMETTKDGVADEEQEAIRILLVDDSPFFRKFMKPVLVVAGFDVTTAEDAIQGYQTLTESKLPFDLVVTDIDMPEVSGIEFTSQCKQNREFASIPFIALTSHSKEELIEKYGNPGFSGFLQKSERDKLPSYIMDVLAHKNNSRVA